MKGRQGTGKPIQKYGQDGQRLAEFAKGRYSQMETSDLDSVIEEGIQSLRRTGGRPAKYADDQQGLDAFVSSATSYLEYIREQNEIASANGSTLIYPTVCGFCVHAGITRESLRHYEKRSEIWSDAIQMIKETILSCKLQLTNCGRIPVVFSIFDLTNNHNFYNTSVFTLKSEDSDFPTHPKSLEEIQQELGLESDDTEED